MDFAVVRLGRDSIEDINHLDNPKAIVDSPFDFTFRCTQVEEKIAVGSYVFIWLGSDNNKGQSTSWKQGLRALAQIINLKRGKEFNDESEIGLRVIVIFPGSIDQFDFLDRCPAHYKYFSKYPVIGVRSSRQNAIQKVHEGERQETRALLTAINILFPEVESQLKARAPELLGLLNFVPVGDLMQGKTMNTTLDTDDSWAWISNEIFEKGERNFLFIGPPGTGKTWYAYEIARRLTSDDPSRSEFLQFHPSFSYDDFVEGFTPKLQEGTGGVSYALQDKHFLRLAAKAAADGNNLYVMVIDEITRGDPSRVFGELLTYIELAHRNKSFSLAYSGRKMSVPSNLVIIATANPYDRSVGELDDALIRRFAIREFPPSADALAKRLKDQGVSEAFGRKLLHIFGLANVTLPHGFGHAHLWNVKSDAEFMMLWKSKLLFILKRAMLFNEEKLRQLTEEIQQLFPEENNVEINEANTKTANDAERR